MEEPVAVYGTLRRGGENHSILSSGEPMGVHRVEGYVLHDHGRYPYAVPGKGSVLVEVYRVSAETIIEMDDLEETPNLYRREKVSIGDMESWFYIYAEKPAPEDPRIFSGDWLLHNGKPGAQSMGDVNTPLGVMRAGFHGDTLTSLLFMDRCKDSWSVEKKVGGISQNPLSFDLQKELDAYFNGTLREFSIPMHTGGSTFQQKVWNALRDIPYGELCTYRRLAEAMGTPGAARAVGGAVGKNPVTILVPCHRVVASNGMGGFSCGLWRKEKLLKLEGW